MGEQSQRSSAMRGGAGGCEESAGVYVLEEPDVVLVYELLVVLRR